jgi:hypothetical protein
MSASYPIEDLADQEDGRSAEGGLKPAQLMSIGLPARAHVQCEIAVDQVKLKWLSVRRLQIGRDERLGIQRESPVPAGPEHGKDGQPQVMPKHPIAIQLAGLTVSPVRARPPKNEVVIAAAPIKTPARDRSSVTTRSCSSNARLASS